MGRRCQPPGIDLQPAHLILPPARVLGPFLGEDGRPVFADQIEEREHPLPVLRIGVRNKVFQRIEGQAFDLDLVEEPRQIGGEQGGLIRGGGPRTRARPAGSAGSGSAAAANRPRAASGLRNGRQARRIRRFRRPAPGRFSSSSVSPIGRRRGRISARPSARRRNASRRAPGRHAASAAAPARRRVPVDRDPIRPGCRRQGCRRTTGAAEWCRPGPIACAATACSLRSARWKAGPPPG